VDTGGGLAAGGGPGAASAAGGGVVCAGADEEPGEGDVDSATAAGAAGSATAGSVSPCARAGCARPSDAIREVRRVATKAASTVLERRLHSPSCNPSPSAAKSPAAKFSAPKPLPRTLYQRPPTSFCPDLPSRRNVDSLSYLSFRPSASPGLDIACKDEVNSPVGVSHPAVWASGQTSSSARLGLPKFLPLERYSCYTSAHVPSAWGVGES